MDICCRKAAELSSKAIDGPLTRYEKLCWALHLLICSACRRYRHQLRAMRAALRQLPPFGLQADEARASADADLGKDALDRLRAAVQQA